MIWVTYSLSEYLDPLAKSFLELLMGYKLFEIPWVCPVINVVSRAA